MKDNIRNIPVRFVADVHLIKILGEQLIGSEKVGILELVKNAYDANATICKVIVEKVPNLPTSTVDDSIEDFPGPIITIQDNGDGMNENSIVHGWMRPATTIKTSVKEQLKRERALSDKKGTRAEFEALIGSLKKERGGRLPLGEKGVGRFATHRLGRYLLLRTKSKDEDNEWFLEIDWNDFESASDLPLDLETVELKLVSQPPSIDYGPTNSGTKLTIFGGREGYEWDREKLLEIGQALTYLQSPAKSAVNNGFKVEFISSQLTEEIEIPTNTIPSPFELVALIDENGMADIEISFTPPSSLKAPIAPQTWSEVTDLRKLLIRKDPDYWKETNNKLRKPLCGPFTLEVKVWIRLNEWIDAPDWRAFRDYLQEFGGIGIFRDGLSILPAQVSSRDDWLELSNRHIMKGDRISYYNMAGSIDLVQEKTLDLVDRTSREGLLETQAYRDLKTLVQSVLISFLEFRVGETRNRYNELKRGKKLSAEETKKQSNITTEIFSRISSNYDFGSDTLNFKPILSKDEDPRTVLRNIRTTIEDLNSTIDDLVIQSNGLAEAAGYGIAIAVALHEIEKVTSNLYFGIDEISNNTLGFDQETRKKIFDLRDYSKALLNELKRLAPLRVTRIERRREFSIRDSIMAAAGAFRLTWNEMGLTFIPPTTKSDFKVEGSFGACSQIFANLFDNSTYWIRADPELAKRITVQLDPKTRRVFVADSGPGIAIKMKEHLFELFYSLKVPPSGLGLYITRYYMHQFKGNIRESFSNELIPGFEGAQFTLQFDREKPINNE